MLQSGERVQDRYEVLSLIGEGGLAQVYKVRHMRLGSVHALKLLSWHRKGLARRLLLEGRIQAQLRHPNVVAVTDVIEHSGRLGLLMEYVDHLPLPELIRRPGRLSLDEAIKLFAQVLAGVAAAHKAGVLHRDLKPQNILLARTAHGLMPKVSDFGIAKVMIDDERTGRTMTGMPMGTPGYMAPEQVLDSSGVDARADVFSLGVILFEMLAGQSAFTEDNGVVTVGTTIQRAPRDLEALAPNLPEHVVSAVYRAVEKDREARFASCEEFAEALLVDHPSLLAVVLGQRHPEVVTISPELRTPVPPGLGPSLDTSEQGDDMDPLANWTPNMGANRTLSPPPEDLPPVVAPPVRVASTPAPIPPRSASSTGFDFLSTQGGQPTLTQVNAMGPWLPLTVAGLLLLGCGMGYLLWGGQRGPEPVAKGGGELTAVVAQPASASTAPVESSAAQTEAPKATEAEVDAATKDNHEGSAESSPPRSARSDTPPASTTAAAPTTRTPAQTEVADPPPELTQPAQPAPEQEDGLADVEPEPEGSAQVEEPAPAPAATPAPSLRGDWSGKASGRPLRLYITGQNGRELQAKVTFILGTTQRDTLLYGTIDPDTQRLFLRETGGEQLKLSGALSPNGDSISGTYTREGQRRPLAWDARLEP